MLHISSLVTFDQKLEGSGGDCHAATESVPQNNSPVSVPVDLSEVN